MLNLIYLTNSTVDGPADDVNGPRRERKGADRARVRRRPFACGASDLGGRSGRSESQRVSDTDQWGEDPRAEALATPSTIAAAISMPCAPPRECSTAHGTRR